MSALEQAREALKDMLSGWKYIRETHGDLYGVGWDRAQDKVERALAALDSAASAESVAFRVGNVYQRQDGTCVRLVRENYGIQGYETVEDEDGCNYYNRPGKNERGRCTGTAHDFSDPRNLVRLYASPPAAPSVRVPDFKDYEPGEDDNEYRQCRDGAFAAGWNACRAETLRLNGVKK